VRVPQPVQIVSGEPTAVRQIYSNIRTRTKFCNGNKDFGLFEYPFESRSNAPDSNSPDFEARELAPLGFERRAVEHSFEQPFEHY
jgi:hypothetical protein